MLLSCFSHVQKAEFNFEFRTQIQHLNIQFAQWSRHGLSSLPTLLCLNSATGLPSSILSYNILPTWQIIYFRIKNFKNLLEHIFFNKNWYRTPFLIKKYSLESLRNPLQFYRRLFQLNQFLQFIKNSSNFKVNYKILKNLKLGLIS